MLAQLDCCPLGTGAGYGVPLPLDRGYAAELLGFSRVQRNPLDVQNSRGRMETYFVRVAADVAAVLEKLSSDLMLFSTAEFGFFSLPEALTTGSSIMPQKRNPDVLELMRAGAGRLRARQHELEWLAGKLPSGYHRDLQLTKGPMIEAADQIAAMLPIMRRIVASVCDPPRPAGGGDAPRVVRHARRPATGASRRAVPPGVSPDCRLATVCAISRLRHPSRSASRGCESRCSKRRRPT